MGRYAEIFEVISAMFRDADTWSASDVRNRLEDAGINGNPELIRRARQQLGIGYFMEYSKDGVLIRWVWTTRGRIAGGWSQPAQRYPDGKPYKGQRKKVA